MQKRTLLIIGSILLAVALLVFGATYFVYRREMRERIPLGVTVAGLDVGGMTPREARAALRRALPDPAEQGLALVAGERRWPLAWADVGQRYDVDAAVAAAFAAQKPAALGVPVLPADPARVTAFVEALAPELARDPVDARLDVGPGGLVAASGQAGQRLDVAATAERALAALDAQAEAASETSFAVADAPAEPDAVELALAPVPPRRAEPEPAYGEAQALLAGPFALSVADPLTGDPPLGYRAEFTAPPDLVLNWLVPRPTPERIRLNFDQAAVRAWVAGIAPQLGEARTLDVEATAQRVLLALYQGERGAAGVVRHPPTTYTVQPGDTFSLIAYEHDFPQWHLERANPGVEPGQIDVGQVITIPSLDVLFPHPLVPGKRIEVDLGEQLLRAYEDEALIFEFKVSSGMSKTPTIDGQFQVLFKEEDAFARRWRLDMPYFMGIYEEDEGFYNGFHELPITAYGTRLSASVLGWPASYGCIILGEGDAKALYDWAPVGTLVRIVGYAPGTPTWQQTLSDIAPLVDDGESP